MRESERLSMADERVVTELVIDADTSGADRYSQAMDNAANSGRSMTSSSHETALAVAGLSAAAVAAYAAINSGLNFVAGLNKELAGLNAQAKSTGLTLQDLQGVKFGGAVAGLSEGEMNAGLARSAQLLNDASRNSNSLSKALAENGVSIRSANGELISQNKLLQVAADLVSRAKNPGDQRALAEMLGFSKEWIPLLEQGATSMSELGKRAKEAGAVIDDDIIERATEFDKQWRKSSVEMEYYMKSALMGLLPYADDLIERLSTFVKSIDLAKAAAAADAHVAEVLKPGEAALEDAGVGGIRIGFNADTSKAIQDFINAPFFSDEFWSSAGRALASGIQVISPQDIKWSSGTSAVMDTSDATLQGMKEAAGWDAAGKAWSKYSGEVVAGAGRIRTAYSSVPGRETGENGFDRAAAQIEKHTARTLADVEAVGKGAGALAGLRAEATLYAAAAAAGTPVTQALRDRIQDLAQDAGDAAVALEKAKIASQIRFGGDTAFLSQQDIQIAQQLRGLYGDDVPAALASSEAAGLRLNSAMRDISQSMEGALTSGLTDIVSGSKTADQAFADMSKSIIRSIEQMIIKITIIEPMMRGLQMGFGGMFGGSAGGLPLPGQSNFIGPVVGSAHGNIFDSGNVVPFARGGVVDRATTAPMALFGEAGPEAIVPLRRGADGNLGIAAAGGGGGRAPIININNYSDAKAETSTDANGDVTVSIRKMVNGMIVDSLANGDGGRAVENKYGLKQFAGA